MNKAELIDALATRLGDKRTANTALDAVLAEVQTAVTKGEKVSITGFGVFEKRVRAARMARNPRTGAAVRVKKTSVPAFRPGSNFKEMVASGRVPRGLKAAPAKAATKKAAPAKKAAKRTAATRASTAKKATRATPRKASTAKRSPAKRAPAKRAATKRATKRR